LDCGCSLVSYPAVWVFASCSLISGPVVWVFVPCSLIANPIGWGSDSCSPGSMGGVWAGCCACEFESVGNSLSSGVEADDGIELGAGVGTVESGTDWLVAGGFAEVTQPVKMIIKNIDHITISLEFLIFFCTLI